MTRAIDVLLTNESGEVVFKKDQFLIPDDWSDRAGLIVASKYATEEENSVEEVINRVVDFITNAGIKQKYFDDETESNSFRTRLFNILINQRAAFNSPVYFNCGVMDPPQSSACFLGAVEDDMQDILAHAQRAGMIFKSGSGIGVNVSKLRAEGEALSKRGKSSGPLSFMKSWDRNAAVIKSGGKSRRAAVLVRMDTDHPDIEKFITCKAEEEKKAKILIKAGIPPKDAYETVDYQNANHSVGITNDFMNKVLCDDDEWSLINRGNKQIARKVSARKLFRSIAESAWASGDPGIQFHNRINDENPTPHISDIDISNPCQPEFATILTHDGIRYLSDINIGDMVWSGKSFTKVTNKVCTGIKPIFRYQTTAGYFLGTSDHNIFQAGERIKVKDAEGIDRAKSFDEFAIYTPQAQDIVDGWVLGDGSVHQASNNLVHLNLGKEDTDIFCSCFSDFITKHRPGIHEYAWEVKTTITAAELPKTYERSIPRRFKQGNREKVIGFLRGLYSANGSICGNRITLKASSFQVISDVQEMLSYLNIASYYTTNKKHRVEFDNGEYECRESYDLNITKDRQRFAAMIGFIHPDKIERLNNILKTKQTSKEKTTYEIIKVEKLGEYPVYDITVEAEEHSYWTGGLLVSNCSEIFGVPWTACNLCSINLVKVTDESNLRIDVDTLVVAQDILIDSSYYPTEDFRRIAHTTRPIGLGVTNLGAYLILNGIPYDSDMGRKVAKDIMQTIFTFAALKSIDLAKKLGHYEALSSDSKEQVRNILLSKINKRFTVSKREIIDGFGDYGIRNSQLTTAPPCGTVSLMMDCDTTGIEPLFAREMIKNLVGGGKLIIIPKCIDGIKDQALTKTANEMDWRDHIKMVAALQDGISSGISKTINMPNNATVDDVEEAFLMAWKMGLKGITVYRDGCKAQQPLQDNKQSQPVIEEAESKVSRRKLPDTRNSITHKFDINNFEGYIHVGLYEDGSVGEIFIEASKMGTVVNGLLDAFATSISLSLQYGVPLEKLIEKFKNMTFEPSGVTSNPDVIMCKSVIDYIFRWIEFKFLTHTPQLPSVVPPNEKSSFEGPLCTNCGGLMQRSGTCFVCTICASTSGCS